MNGTIWGAGFVAMALTMAIGPNSLRAEKKMTQTIERGTTQFKLQSNLIVVDVDVNGHDAQFLLDTGASATLLTRAFADRLKLEEADRYAGAGAGGTVRMSVVLVNSITVAGLTTCAVACPVADLREVREHVGSNIDGILGFDFFGAGALNIDYADRRVTFERPMAGVAEAGSIVSGDRVRIAEFDVELTIPSDAWQVTTNTPLPTMPFVLKGPRGAEIGASFAKAHGMPVAAMKASVDASLSVQVDEFERISDGDVQRAGRPAYRVEYIGTDKGVRKKFITESLLFDSGLLVFTCEAPVGAFSGVEAEMELALSSVRVMAGK